MTRRGWVLTVALLLLAAAGLRLYRLDGFSYGLDEIIQTYWISGDAEFLWRSLKFDAVHPPLDYLVGHSLEALGPADWARKLPQVFWGLGTIAALGLLVARRAGPLAGATAGFFLAIAPFHVRYSQELRPYSLGLLLLCLSLLLLDLFLEKPTWARLALLYFVCLATAYALYMAAVILGIAALAMLVEDAFSPDLGRRRAARRFLLLAPLFLLLLFLAYLPWWPFFREAATRPSPIVAPPLTWERTTRLLSFFCLAPDDGQPLGRKGPFYLLLVVVGLSMAISRRGCRFLAVWAVAGVGAIEVLVQLHPHWYVSRHFLPAGLTFPVLAALPVARLAERRPTRILAGIFAVLVAALALRSLSVYYREGRADWRTLAGFLRAQPPAENVFTENQYTQLCVAFYVVGPQFLFHGGRAERKVWSLQGEAVRIAWNWAPGTTAWLVLGGLPTYPELRNWSAMFPSLSFPKAEGAILRRLDPALWGKMAATVPQPPRPH